MTELYFCAFHTDDSADAHVQTNKTIAMLNMTLFISLILPGSWIDPCKMPEIRLAGYTQVHQNIRRQNLIFARDSGSRYPRGVSTLLPVIAPEQ
jgi:hypothetical protein